MVLFQPEALHLRPCVRVVWQEAGVSSEYLADVVLAFTLPVAPPMPRDVAGVVVHPSAAEVLATHTEAPFLFVQWHKIIVPTSLMPCVFSSLEESYSIVPASDVVSRVYVRPQFERFPRSLIPPITVTTLTGNAVSTFERVIAVSNNPVLRVG